MEQENPNCAFHLKINVPVLIIWADFITPVISTALTRTSPSAHKGSVAKIAFSHPPIWGLVPLPYRCQTYQLPPPTGPTGYTREAIVTGPPRRGVLLGKAKQGKIGRNE